MKPKQSSSLVLPLLALTAGIALYAELLPTTAAEQKALTPAAVLKELKEGNARYAAGNVSDPNVKASIAAAATGQHPKAVVLSCLDSRIPVELVFDQGIGDLFVGRVAGNIENDDLIGSFEFATKLAGAKLVVVLGHDECGAVKGACDHVEMGKLTGLLDKIQPAVKAVDGFKDEERNSKHKPFVDAVVKQNVVQTVADLRAGSPILAELEKSGAIRIVGGVYSMKTGTVEWLE
jgi:carbonic anhydrase